jgi:hypothetical protein
MGRRAGMARAGLLAVAGAGGEGVKGGSVASGPTRPRPRAAPTCTRGARA